MDMNFGSRLGIDTEWIDIWQACEHSGLATWQDWIELGRCDIVGKYER
jgi:hypothetical protein